MNKHRTYLIIGCGYLGQHLLQALNDQTVIVTSRTHSKLAQFAQAGYQSLYLDINAASDEFFQQLNAESEITVFFLLPPSQIQLQGFDAFLQRLKTLSIQKAIMVSSTVVYGNAERIVDADSPVMLDSERAKKQFAIEQTWLETSNQFYALRLAGIYGSNRVIGTRNLQQQKPISSDPEAWLNLIHVEDAARLLMKIADLNSAANIELGCDNHPVKRVEYYSWLAQQLDAPAPVFENSNESRGANRQCSSSLTQQRCAWQPVYEDYQAGIRAALKKQN